jgi:glutaredoxin/glutathione-dependent peroxiredoxin
MVLLCPGDHMGASRTPLEASIGVGLARLATANRVVNARGNPERSVGMAIAVGEKIPEVQLMTMTSDGPKPVSSTEALGHGKVVVFAVPGAFTPTCSDHHLPGFVVRADEIRAKGADTIACLSVNDPFVMGAWGRDQKVGDRVLMLADGNGDFTKAVGLEMDGSGIGLGIRSRRYAAILEDGIVTSLFVEQKPGLDVSSAESILAAL